MRFRQHIPRPPLDRFVELIWLFDGAARPWAQERLLPQGTVELVVDLTSSRSDGVVSGPHSRFFLLNTSRPQRLVGVHCKPGGGFPFVGPPMHELRNCVAPLGALWGSAARELQERVAEARSDEEIFRIVERTLQARAGDRLRRHPAVGFALDQFTRVPQMRTIAEVSRQIGLSQRRFIQVFTEEVGLTPKVFCRVRRFQRAIAIAHQDGRPNWSELALDCGYFDQAHFIHDFEAFSGLTPSAWAAQRTEHVNHVPIRD